MHGAKFFSRIDLLQGFCQVRVNEPNIHKTAFRTRYGSYEWMVMPMGMCNSPSTFQSLMNSVFQDYLDDFIIVYLDDVLIYSKTLD